MDRKILVCLMLGMSLLVGCGERRAGTVSPGSPGVSGSVSQIGPDENNGQRTSENHDKQTPAETGEPGTIYVENIYNTGPLVIKTSESLDESRQILIEKAGLETGEGLRKGIEAPQ